MLNPPYRFNEFDPPIPFLTGDAAALHSLLTEFDRVHSLNTKGVREHQAKYLWHLMQHFSKVSPSFSERLLSKLPEKGASLDTLLSLVEPRDKHYFQKVPSHGGKVPKHHLPTHWAKTSGSTGVPLKVEATSVTRAIGMAQVTWAHLQSGVDFSWRLASVKPSNNGVKLCQNWDPATTLLFEVGPMLSISTSIDVALQLDHLEKFQPDFLIVFPSVLKEYLAIWTSGKRRPLSLKMIRTMGETLSDETREAAGVLTGATVLDTYSSSEVERIATQFSSYGPYETNNFSLIVEVLGKNNEGAKPGQPGRIVVTDLFNYATPLIRYEIGDWAEPWKTCGENLRKVRGRARNMVTLPDGRKIWPLVGYRDFCEVVPVRQFQIQQVALGSLTATFCVDSLPTVEESEELKGIIRKNLTYDFDIDARYQLEPLERGPGGKLEDFISLI